MRQPNNQYLMLSVMFYPSICNMGYFTYNGGTLSGERNLKDGKYYSGLRGMRRLET